MSDSSPEPPANLTRWFAAEVQPHKPALRAYLQARFPSLSDHDDIVQEAYTRTLRAKADGTVRYTKALLFTTARNTALDFFRRRAAHPTEAITHFRRLPVSKRNHAVEPTLIQSRAVPRWSALPPTRWFGHRAKILKAR
ncbi:MAG: hypothetical protein HZA93_16310 [Verrucomicrobia bacterium]|nr:hypothetical protein [Verrucomicrobiota bacterium]